MQRFRKAVSEMADFGTFFRGEKMDKLHTVIAMMGAIVFLWFAIPFVARGILNIGNVTGMLLAAMLCGYGVFYVKVHLWLAKFWQCGLGKVVTVAVVLIVILVFGIVVAETIGMVRVARNHPPQNTTAVVLGCSVKGTKPSRVLEERLEAAYDYLIENPEVYCVLSGGQGEGEDISEAECMYRYLTEKGIAPERLLCEDKSTTTEENLLFSKALLEERGISGDITIVTSEFHAYRAAKMAERLGMNSYSTPSHTFFLYLPTYYVRELYGILYYVIK